MEERSFLRELRPNAAWDTIKEVVKLMLPFLAGLGLKEWVHSHATALMWTGAVLVAAVVAFYDRVLPKRRLAGAPLEAPSQLTVASVWNGDKVAFQQEIYGLGALKPGWLPIELRVFAGGFWHVQWPVGVDGNKWHGKCQFGDTELSTGSTYKVVAISPKAPLPKKLADLPADAIKSDIVSVVRPPKLTAPTMPTPKLRLDIMEGLIGERRVNFPVSEAYVFLRVRVSLLQLPPMTVKHWKLRLLLDGEDFETGHLDSLDMAVSFEEEPTTLNTLLGTLGTSPIPKPFDKDLSKLASTEALPLNVGVEGWLSFRLLLAYDQQYICGADFELTAVDELDGEHSITRRPKKWLRKVTVKWR